MPRASPSLGEGATVSAQARMLHPLEHFREEFGSEYRHHRVNDLVVRKLATRKIRGKETQVVIMSHADYPDVEIYASPGCLKLLAAGPSEKQFRHTGELVFKKKKDRTFSDYLRDRADPSNLTIDDLSALHDPYPSTGEDGLELGLNDDSLHDVSQMFYEQEENLTSPATPSFLLQKQKISKIKEQEVAHQGSETADVETAATSTPARTASDDMKDGNSPMFDSTWFSESKSADASPQCAPLPSPADTIKSATLNGLSLSDPRSPQSVTPGRLFRHFFPLQTFTNMAVQATNIATPQLAVTQSELVRWLGIWFCIGCFPESQISSFWPNVAMPPIRTRPNMGQFMTQNRFESILCHLRFAAPGTSAASAATSHQQQQQESTTTTASHEKNISVPEHSQSQSHHTLRQQDVPSTAANVSNLPPPPQRETPVEASTGPQAAIEDSVAILADLVSAWNANMLKAFSPSSLLRLGLSTSLAPPGVPDHATLSARRRATDPLSSTYIALTCAQSGLIFRLAPLSSYVGNDEGFSSQFSAENAEKFTLSDAFTRQMQAHYQVSFSGPNLTTGSDDTVVSTTGTPRTASSLKHEAHNGSTIGGSKTPSHHSHPPPPQQQQYHVERHSQNIMANEKSPQMTESGEEGESCKREEEEGEHDPGNVSVVMAEFAQYGRLASFLLRFTKPLHSSSPIIVMDTSFCCPRTVAALQEHGILACVPVQRRRHTGPKGIPIDMIDDHLLKQPLGVHDVLLGRVGSVEEHPQFGVYALRDSTGIPKLLANYDGVAASEETRTRVLPSSTDPVSFALPRVFADYLAACHVLSDHNMIRGSVLAFEKSWVAPTHAMRQLAFLLAVSEINAWVAYNHFVRRPYNLSPVTLLEFRETLAVDLISTDFPSSQEHQFQHHLSHQQLFQTQAHHHHQMQASQQQLPKYGAPHLQPEDLASPGLAEHKSPGREDKQGHHRQANLDYNDQQMSQAQEQHSHGIVDESQGNNSSQMLQTSTPTQNRTLPYIHIQSPPSFDMQAQSAAKRAKTQ